jgi:hypothetical protein
MTFRKIEYKDNLPIFVKKLDDLLISDLLIFFKNTHKIEINKILAGNIKEEYDLINFIPRFEKELYEDIFNNKELKKIMHSKAPLKKFRLSIKEFWINIQKKHEFNPLHDHFGLFSFNIFVQVPFSNEEEYINSPGFKGHSNLAGCLQFVYNTPLGGLRTFNIAMDKKLNGCMLLFPSELWHQVYPFYTSDKNRITAAGNIYFEE